MEYTLEEEIFVYQKELENDIEDQNFNDYINLSFLSNIDLDINRSNEKYYMWKTIKNTKKPKKYIPYHDTLPDFIDDNKKRKSSKKYSKKS